MRFVVLVVFKQYELPFKIKDDPKKEVSAACSKTTAVAK